MMHRSIFTRLNPRRLITRALRAQDGNVALLSAVLMVPMTGALGMGVDYGLQRQRQEQLNGIADATALLTLSPSVLAMSTADAQTAAQSFWNSQVQAVNGVTGLNATVSITDTGSGNLVLRTVKVAYSGTSVTYMSSLMGLSSLPVSGSNTAESSLAPRINFYLLVDTSPSMGIAATQAGINTMVSHTSAQGGCAFGCHETNPTASDTAGNPINPATGQAGDNYYLARSLGVTLRIDLVNQAVSNLMSTAATAATKNNTTYGVSISTIDYQVGQLYQTNNIATNLSQAKAAVGTLQQLEVAYNNCVSVSNCNAKNAGSDQDSYLDLGVSTLGHPVNANSYSAANTPGFQIYTPGLGTNNAGDSPQEVMFIISDGVVDENRSGSRVYDPINTLVDNCTAIKNAGIRIAFLYLTYNPLPTNSWYNTYVAPFQPNIAAAAQSCASPGLFTQVNTGGDISGALSNLFQVAVTTARLTQ